MSNTRKIITVRVNEDTYRRFKIMCQKEKRSMSAQGELLIDEFVGDDDSVLWFGKDDNEILAHIRRTMNGETE